MYFAFHHRMAKEAFYKTEKLIMVSPLKEYLETSHSERSIALKHTKTGTLVWIEFEPLLVESHTSLRGKDNVNIKIDPNRWWYSH